jgi:predicted metal-dependent HD superfamily phosphohydrolase
MLREIFKKVCEKYTSDEMIILSLWNEIEKNYSAKKRYFHNLDHLSHLYSQLELCRKEIYDYDAILFALFYHDIIYNVLKSDNEEKSGELAMKRLKEIRFPEERMIRCKSHIISTKSHVVSTDSDTNLFTDADLSVLGSSPGEYKTYSQKIRNEYSIYPDLIYNPGRKKVLKHFLEMKRIFKTEFFYSSYEKKARINLEWELNALT